MRAACGNRSTTGAMIVAGVARLTTQAGTEHLERSKDLSLAVSDPSGLDPIA